MLIRKIKSLFLLFEKTIFGHWPFVREYRFRAIIHAFTCVESTNISDGSISLNL
ncbi:hypothetical protein HMP0721_1740 [Pseudoramibacter alactolyticus ATCC 23263]|uniref:Uncharacterized protein n=1 Tax=Pseudoramibacter alactolyticus ATCC 23263 TaxID=887929 RepID=E6MI35_9FIRM|nr:hypothetical protein HMP0721_1740 [Pseudoramibacter alactolyticus ATCC 23263]